MLTEAGVGDPTSHRCRRNTSLDPAPPAEHAPQDPRSEPTRTTNKTRRSQGTTLSGRSLPEGVKGPQSNTAFLAKRLEQLLAQLPPRREPATKRQEPLPDTLPRLSRVRAAALVADYEAGATVYQLAEQYGVHRQTVSRILKRSGVTLRHRTLTADQIAEVRSAHEAGEPIYTIATRLGVQPNTIRKLLKEPDLVR